MLRDEHPHATRRYACRDLTGDRRPDDYAPVSLRDPTLRLDRFPARLDTARMDVSCVAGILAGGASRRLGEPKALLRMPGGSTLLEHVAQVASCVTDRVVILGRPPGTPQALASLPVLPDRVPGRGPMGGLCSLLEYAAPDWGVLVACDLPALRASVLERLLRTAAKHPDAEAVAFESQDDPETYESCCAAYHSRLRPEVIDLLERGSAGLQPLLRRARTVALRPSTQEAEAMVDVDTVQDLGRLGDGLG